MHIIQELSNKSKRQSIEMSEEKSGTMEKIMLAVLEIYSGYQLVDLIHFMG